MPPLGVTLISGKSVVEFEDFQGNGSELRERVASELRLSPPRVKLLAGSREIPNEEIITEEVNSITAMVGEGQELPEWCKEHLPLYSFEEVDGAGVLPEGSEEIDPKLLGRAILLSLRRFRRRMRGKYCGTLRAMGVVWDIINTSFLFNLFNDFEEFDVKFAKRKLPNQADLGKWERLHQETCSDQKRLKEATEAFIALDDRLRTLPMIRCYSRWETHDVNGVPVRHRIYGLRQAFAAVEFSKVNGKWIEEEGCLSRQASAAILDTWSGYYTRSRRAGREDGNDLRREAPIEEVASRFETLCNILAAAHEGREEAVWLKPHLDEAIAAMMKGFRKETTLLAATDARPDKRDEEEACRMILRRAIHAMLRASASLEKLQDEALDAVLWMADHRNDAIRIFGLELLCENFSADERASTLLLQLSSSTDWPHMHAYTEESAAKAVHKPPLPEASEEAPTTLPSARRLIHQSLRENPVKVVLCGDNYDDHLNLKHILYEKPSCYDYEEE